MRKYSKEQIQQAEDWEELKEQARRERMITKMKNGATIVVGLVISIAVWVFVENFFIHTFTPDIFKIKIVAEEPALQIPGLSLFAYLQDKQKYTSCIIFLIILLVVLLIISGIIVYKIAKKRENRQEVDNTPSAPPAMDYYNISQYNNNERTGE
jgi:competence protein ComGC